MLRYYITDRLAAGGAAALLECVQRALAQGVERIQIREKDLSARELALVTREALRVATSVGRDERLARILVNDRLDVALGEGATGAHLGENSLPVEEAKRLVANCASRLSNGNFLIGSSCHSLDAARTAAADGADYIFFGPVFTTPTKATYGAPQGLERLAQVCRSVSIPVFAIGGIALENARACIQAGAAGLAAIRLFQDALEPTALVKALRHSLSDSFA